jgi:Zn-dependent protease with chaperone function
MNFFEHQARARRDSRRLVLLFLLAVAGVVAALDGFVLLSLRLLSEEAPPPWGELAALHAALLGWIAAGVVTVIVAASLYKSALLRSGGAVVARGLGGEAVLPGCSEPPLRRLRNVVEEMAIASGVPVPAIYWLPKESGINAFAAGYTPADAAIAVTRGALEKLTRDELQGVIGHEFSHVLNGDMRLNIRIMGLLFGVLVIALAGRTVMRLSLEADDARATAAGIAAGLAMTLVGYIGYVFGQMIRAGVSRQREYLADASAVQFTRQTTGLAGALKKLAGFERGARLDSAGREDVSHMLFGDGVGYHLLFATHPPLIQRICALEPAFAPSRLKALAREWNAPGFRLPDDVDGSPVSALGDQGARQVEPARVSQQVGLPTDADLQCAVALRDSLPEALLALARDGGRAPQLLCALLLEVDAGARAAQRALLLGEYGEAGADAIEALLPRLAALQAAQRLPLAALAFPMLRQRPRVELVRLMRLIGQLIQADGRISLFEYCLGRLLRQEVQDLLHPASARISGRAALDARAEAIATVLSVLAQQGHVDPAQARAACVAGLQQLLPRQALHYDPPSAWQPALDRALSQLETLSLPAKERLIEGLVCVLSHDGRITVAESELLRVICAALRCPLPPALGFAAG